LAFSPDGTRLASGGQTGDPTVRIWDTATGNLIAICRGHESRVLTVSYRPDGGRLLSTSSDETARQWDAATGQQAEPAYDRHTGEVTAGAYSPDGKWIATAGIDRTVRVWRATGRQDLAVLHGHAGAVTGLAFDAGGRRLASSSNEAAFWGGDGTVRLWDVDDRATLPVLRGHERAVYPTAVSPDGRWIASGSWDATVRVWDAVTGEPCATLRHRDVVYSLAYSPDGKWLVSATNDDNTLRIWDVATGRVHKQIAAPAGSFRSVTVSPDGMRLAETAFEHRDKKHRLHVVDIASGERLFSAEGWALAYSPDGRWLAVLAADGTTVLLLNARTHEIAARLLGHEKQVMSGAFSLDGRRLATCSSDRTVRLWQVEDGDCQVLRGHTDEVFAAAFHPDGRRLATGGRDRAVWLWDLDRGEEVARLQGHTSFVWSLAFSPDGATLVSGSGDATVRLWDTTPLKVRYQARRAVEAARPDAVRLVTRLFAELGEPSQVVARLRSDASLSDPLRRAAFQEVMRQGNQ
jgi:WD40 repeat protein